MIHFQCQCGTTLSAAEEDRGRRVTCLKCGRELAVPAVNSKGTGLANGSAVGKGHDFDAEIVTAARISPPRPRKTPRRVETPPERDTEEGKAPPRGPAGYDLVRLESLAGALGRLSWIGLFLFGAGAGIALALPDASIATRTVLAAILLAFAVAGFFFLRILGELGRSIVGLAERQRETMASLAKRLRRRSPR